MALKNVTSFMYWHMLLCINVLSTYGFVPLSEISGILECARFEVLAAMLIKIEMLLDVSRADW